MYCTPSSTVQGVTVLVFTKYWFAPALFLKSCCVEIYGHPTKVSVADSGLQLGGRSADIQTGGQTWLPNKPLLLLKEHPVIKRETGTLLAAERKCYVEQLERKFDTFSWKFWTVTGLSVTGTWRP
jgi:hypothetical protein